jgi:antitoxin VapB
MALSIKNREVEENARVLAKLTGKPLTQAVNDALIREIKREKAIKSAPPNDSFWDEIRAIQARVAALPVLDDRHPDNILYDEFGLPK